MASKNSLPMIGAWLFLLGLVIAIVGGFMSYTWMPWILGVIGIIVGLVNIGDKEVNSFLIAESLMILSTSTGRRRLKWRSGETETGTPVSLGADLTDRHRIARQGLAIAHARPLKS